MICAEAQRFLDGYIDNELDLRSSLEVEQHLSRCPACGAEERALREQQAFARQSLTRHQLPPGLEAKLRASLRPRRRQRWALAMAPAAAAAVLLIAVAPRLWQAAPAASAGDAVIAVHVRSLLANHLTDVASSDQHTVKPWFQGKLDYGVPARDFAAEGFPLVGGRLEYVEDAPAAALVYKRAQHVVNLLIWPSKRAGDEPLQHFARRGYNAYCWAKDGMHYWAVSDLNQAELQKFAGLIQSER